MTIKHCDFPLFHLVYSPLALFSTRYLLLKFLLISKLQLLFISNLTYWALAGRRALINNWLVNIRGRISSSEYRTSSSSSWLQKNREQLPTF